MTEKLKKIIKKDYKWIILFICVILFLAILEDVFEYETLALDTSVYNIVVEKMRNSILTDILKIITKLGSAFVLITITILSLIILKNKKIGLCITLNLALSTLLNVLLKNIIQRPRPEGYRLIEETGFSFPSGHSMVNTAFYGLLIYLIIKNVKNKKLKYALSILISILILAIGFSRIYLGVHYTSDVLAGFLISVAYLIVFTTILQDILKIEKGEIK